MTGTPNRFDSDPSSDVIIYLVSAPSLVAFLVKLIRLRGSERASVAWVIAGFAGAYAESRRTCC